MRVADLPSVLAIEEDTFPVPWTFQNFLHEIEKNPFAHSRVLRSGNGRVVAYASIWLVDGEIRINNLAVRRECRRAGVGERLLRHLLELGRRGRCRRASLEVRPSNLAAASLYRKLGFRVVGRRKGYYSDSHEDALLMSLDL